MNLQSTLKQDVLAAVDSAKEAFNSYKDMPAPSRAQILKKIAQGLRRDAESFARTMCQEMGKTIREGLVEVSYSADYLDWFAGEAERIYALGVPSSHAHKQIWILQQPIGVCAAITPWNFPLAMAARKAAPALAAGCTILIKPASESPRTIKELERLALREGLPSGCLQSLEGDEQLIGKVLMESEAVRKLSFTGSCEVGKLLYRGSAETLKKLTLELGGHAPFIVCRDADVDLAVQETIKAKLRNNGQTCIAASRFFVHADLVQDYTFKLIQTLSKLRVGDPNDPNTDLTNVLHYSVKEKMQRHVQDALEKGAQLEYEGGDVYHPKVLSRVTEEMLAFQEETFGPLIPIKVFHDEKEVLHLANSSPYGLAGYIFSKDLGRAYRLAENLQVGVIGINDGAPSAAQVSFGGIKQSGFGREGGPSGIREYLVDKCLSINVS